MDVFEFIGFIISILALIFILTQRVKSEVNRNKHPEEFEAKQKKEKETLKKFLKSLDLDVEESEDEPPQPALPLSSPPKSQPLKEYQLREKLSQHQLRKNFDDGYFKSDLEKRYKDYDSNIIKKDLRERRHDDPYRIVETRYNSRLKKMMDRLPSKKEMFLFYEIMKPAKALEDESTFTQHPYFKE